ncbi:uncharacterized protein, YkwD family [Lentibacillus persicus]|uniref:Uncharacterized protein, YkwD family n=2 Tax=Lentibacillus persicus TaxID=640948 RepID=A0A1I1VTK0_9BACI|nr:uncharacterized protein, YkwD family [Lentibacillus persicus]
MLSTGFLAFLLVLTMQGAVSAANINFNDVDEGDAHHEGIMQLAQEGIINGYEDGSFGTFDNVTRQQVAVMLSLAMNLEAPSNIDQTLEIYNDVNQNSLYAEEIAAVTQAGIFKGSNGKFKPTNEITRQQMATVLVLGLNLKDYETNRDVDIYLENVDPSHAERVQTLANLGITTQLNDFRPAEMLVRGQFATFLYESMKITGMLTDENISTSTSEEEVVELVNEERVKRDLEPLEMHSRLSDLARRKSRDMALNNYFSHTSPTYGSPFDMMRQFDFSFRTAGENIAAGQRSPEQVVESWMNSEGHRENILNEGFTHIGVGYVEDTESPYRTYWTQLFMTP